MSIPDYQVLFPHFSLIHYSNCAVQFFNKSRLDEIYAIEADLAAEKASRVATVNKLRHEDAKVLDSGSSNVVDDILCRKSGVRCANH